jgi:hypothetical protein
MLLMLIKLGTNDYWTIAFVTACSILYFILPWQWGDISKLPKIAILRWFFSIKTDFKVLQPRIMDWDRVKELDFSVLVTPYLKIDFYREAILSLSQVQNFLNIEGEVAPFKPPCRRGHIHPLVAWDPILSSYLGFSICLWWI